MIILVFISPNVVEIWESALTLGFFPILLIFSFLADKNFFCPKEKFQNFNTGYTGYTGYTIVRQTPPEIQINNNVFSEFPDSRNFFQIKSPDGLPNPATFPTDGPESSQNPPFGPQNAIISPQNALISPQNTPFGPQNELKDSQNLPYDSQNPTNGPSNSRRPSNLIEIERSVILESGESVTAISPDEVAIATVSKIEKDRSHLKTFYRLNASHWMSSKLFRLINKEKVSKMEKIQKSKIQKSKIEFGAQEFGIFSCEKEIRVKILRSGGTENFFFKFQTISGTAEAGIDFFPMAEENFYFEKNQTEKFIEIQLKKNPNEKILEKIFYLQISKFDVLDELLELP